MAAGSSAAVDRKERKMMDLVMIALGTGAFALLACYGALCARL